MPPRRPSTAARWEGYRRKYGSTPGITAAAPLSPITYPTTRLRTLVEIAPGADLTADPLTWSWVDITSWARHDLGISVVAGRRDQSGVATPGQAVLKLDNRDGRFTRRNPLGPYYGQLSRDTPIRIAVDPGDGMHYRFYGYVNAWPKRWDRSGNDSTVTITCGGLLRRLGRAPAVRSPLFRSISGISAGDYVPYAYWPCEDGSSATQIASGLPGGAPMTSSGLTFAADSSVVGSAELPTIAEGGHALAIIPSYTNTGQFVNQWVMKVPSSAPAAETLLWQVTTASPERAYRFSVSPSLNALVLRTYTGGVQESIVTLTLDGTGGPAATAANFYGHSFMFGLSSSPFGGSIATEVKIFDSAGDDFIPSSSLGQIIGSTTTGRVTTAGIPYADTGLSGVAFGHNALFVDTAFNVASDQADNAAAMPGNAGEMAHVRMARLCREEGLPFTTSATVSAQMGPQLRGNLLAVLRDCEAADLGVLYETGFGLGYKALSEYYNQPVSMTLDATPGVGHVGDPPETEDDDLRFRNLYTVSRTNGSSSTFEDDDSDDTVGTYDGTATVNVYADSQAADVAGWLVHRDTIDADYWTGVKLRFSRAPDLIPAWTALPFGARAQITNPPSQAEPGDVDMIVEGWSERWDQVKWEATLNTSPALVYQVLELDHATLGLLDSGSSTLTADISDSATSMQVTTSDSLDLWSTSGADYPVDIIVGGEQMTVTAVSGATSPQTFTVTRAVNGIAKSQTAGSEVHVYPEPVLPL